MRRPPAPPPKKPAKPETVSYAYNFKSRNNLKRGGSPKKAS
jgi:hypothetical protein